MKRGSSTHAGASLVGLLVALVIMGGAATIVLSVDGGGGGHGSGASNDVSAAAQATCRTDYQAVQQAAGAYTAEHGRPPANTADLAGILRDPVNSSSFSISIGAGGQVEVAAPGHVAAPGDANCAYSG